MTDLPVIALSVRQPWAWAIIHAGKDVENRSAQSVKTGGMAADERICIHAARTMTRRDYDDAVRFMDALGVAAPAPADLVRGAIIGSVYVADIVRTYASPWFTGPCGLALSEPQACAPIPAHGRLGYFHWPPGGEMVPPAAWMTAYPGPRGRSEAATEEAD